jgi:chemotaxis protein methyltransferase CheR/type IV pilus assembly protein PilK
MADSSGCAQAFAQPRPLAGLRLDMDDRTFAEWTGLLERHTGLFIAPERRSFLVSGIRARMRANGCSSSQEYYAQLTNGRNHAHEWSLLVDSLTVHETCFFRHQASMQMVREKLVPEVLEKESSYLAWSVGCATGEEAYSLAMQIDSCMFPERGECFFGVTGTDISLPSLRHAREGVYLKRRLRDVPESFRDEYCQSVSGNHFRVVDKLRKRVCFTQLNLRDLKDAPMAKVNLIYCQNLLIYYDRKRRTEIVDSLAEFLRPGGVMVLGAGELLDWRNSKMEKVRYPDTLAFRRTN